MSPPRSPPTPRASGVAPYTLPRVGALLFSIFAFGCAAQGPEPVAASQELQIPWETKGKPAGSGVVADAGAAPVALRPLESCGDSSEGFEGWLESFRRHSAGQGIYPATVAAALQGVHYDDEVVALDRSQTAHKLSFDEFYARHATSGRLSRGRELRRQLAQLLAKIEGRFGVAPEVLVAIWGLETDYGENMGYHACFRSLATLAYDCRRAELFRGELLSALRILQRGDLQAQQMVGAWAGELGQTQFLPSSYEQFAVDFDGDGAANLVGSSTDALASTANYLAKKGWRAKQGYDPKSYNFKVLSEWNRSEVYCRTVAKFAGKIGKGRRTSRWRCCARLAPVASDVSPSQGSIWGRRAFPGLRPGPICRAPFGAFGDDVEPSPSSISESR